VSTTTTAAAILLSQLGRVQLELHAAEQVLQRFAASAPHDFAEGVDHRIGLGREAERVPGRANQRFGNNQAYDRRSGETGFILSTPMIDQLYEKVGGTGKIRELVRVFYDRVMADPRLAPFFPDTDIESLKAKQVMFLVMLLGPARVSAQLDLRAAHSSARAEGMTDAHFDAMLGHFGAAMREMDVEDDYIREVIARLETTRKDVLGR
jgi:hemoglobin